MKKNIYLVILSSLCSFMTIAQSEELFFTPEGNISRIFKLDNILYYTTEFEGVHFIDLNDPSFTSQVLINTLNNPAGMTFKDGFLYVSDYSEQKVIKLDLAQSNPEPIDVTISAQNPNDLIFVGDILYYSSNPHDRVYSYDINSGTQIAETLVVLPNGPIGLEYLDGYLYIVVPLGSNIYRKDLTDENSALELVIDGAPPELFHPLNLEIYENELYMANSYSSNILKVNLANEPYATEEVLELMGVKDLLIEDDVLYYCNSAFIYRVDLSSLGVSEQSFQTSKLYPNPSRDHITISNLDTSTIYEIYDSVGRVVKNGTINPNERIDTIDLSQGHYFIELEDIDQIFRFVKI